MNARELLVSSGAIVEGPDAEARTVRWTTPAGELVEFEVLVRKLRYLDIERLSMRLADQDLEPDDGELDDGRRSIGAEVLAAAVLIGDPPEPLTYEDACRLAPKFAAALVREVKDVNGGLGDAIPKP